MAQDRRPFRCWVLLPGIEAVHGLLEPSPNVGRPSPSGEGRRDVRRPGWKGCERHV